MSPRRFAADAPDAVVDADRRLWFGLGRQIREARLAKRLSVQALAAAAGVSRDVVYLVEAGRRVSTEGAMRLVGALSMRLEFVLSDPRRRQERPSLGVDPVHSAMGEFEARKLRAAGLSVGMDEPYQHYQYAGRADVIAWDLDARALLHIENRTRFPDFQEMAGAYNAERAYLGQALAQRLGIRRWRSETHVMAAPWSAEVLHAIRLRTESFRSLCPDSPDSFESWWHGHPPHDNEPRSIFVVLDPLATGRQQAYAGLEQAVGNLRPRYRGYAGAAQRMGG